MAITHSIFTQWNQGSIGRHSPQHMVGHRCGRISHHAVAAASRSDSAPRNVPPTGRAELSAGSASLRRRVCRLARDKKAFMRHNVVDLSRENVIMLMIPGSVVLAAARDTIDLFCSSAGLPEPEAVEFVVAGSAAVICH